ncbi:hypothetical protein [Streptomyces sp. NPDC005476]|uniref:hypothetical protein n=1 Tax=Streptomyces sp. NPDC005476 TaxID=3156882 RepID=UPI003452CD2F
MASQKPGPASHAYALTRRGGLLRGQLVGEVVAYCPAGLGPPLGATHQRRRTPTSTGEGGGGASARRSSTA